jgi:hypothetical protein
MNHFLTLLEHAKNLLSRQANQAVVVEREELGIPLAHSKYVDMSVALFILGYIDELKTHSTAELLEAVNRWGRDKGYRMMSELTLSQFHSVQADSQTAIN